MLNTMIVDNEYNNHNNSSNSQSSINVPTLVTTKELDLGVDVMHGCSTEGGDSTLSVFSWELL